MQIEFNGRLGNQLFQYAFLRHIENKYNTIVKCDLQSYDNNSIELTKVFDISLKNVPKKERVRIQLFPKRLYRIMGDKIWFYNSKVVNEKNLNFSEINENTYFKGFWQNEDYFRDIRNTIIKELVFRDFEESKNRDLMNRLKKSNSVSIHVRRTDYISIKENKDFYLCLYFRYNWDNSLLFYLI